MGSGSAAQPASGSESSDDFCRCRLALPAHRLNRRELLEAISILREKLVRVRFILELRHDLGGSILRPEDCIIPFIEIKYLPDFSQDRLTDRRTNFQCLLRELADGFSTFLHDFVAIGALIR